MKKENNNKYGKKNSSVCLAEEQTGGKEILDRQGPVAFEEALMQAKKIRRLSKVAESQKKRFLIKK